MQKSPLLSPSNSCLGIASFIISLFSLAVLPLIFLLISAEKIGKFILLIMGLIIIVTMWFVTLGHFYPSLKDLGVDELTLIEPWMIIIEAIFLVIALGLGVAGLMQPEYKKAFAVLGYIFSISGLLAAFGIYQLLN